MLPFRLMEDEYFDFFQSYIRALFFVNLRYEASFLSSSQKKLTTEHRRKYLRVNFESTFNEDFEYVIKIFMPLI